MVHIDAHAQREEKRNNPAAGGHFEVLEPHKLRFAHQNTISIVCSSRV